MISRLSDNLAKSYVYLSGVIDDVKSSILSLLNMDYGGFPFRYLGVPLYSKKLNALDYKSLIDKITAKIQSCSAKLLLCWES